MEQATMVTWLSKHQVRRQFHLWGLRLHGKSLLDLAVTSQPGLKGEANPANKGEVGSLSAEELILGTQNWHSINQGILNVQGIPCSCDIEWQTNDYRLDSTRSKDGNLLITRGEFSVLYL
jgi:hypothetical protein